MIHSIFAQHKENLYEVSIKGFYKNQETFVIADYLMEIIIEKFSKLEVNTMISRIIMYSKFIEQGKYEIDSLKRDLAKEVVEVICVSNVDGINFPFLVEKRNEIGQEDIDILLENYV